MRVERVRTIWVLIAVVLLCFTLGLEVSALAQEKDNPCKTDLGKFCANVEPGEGRIMACLDQHKEELSPACKDHITNLLKEAKTLGSDCYDDIMRLCPTKKLGKGEIIQCLKEKERQGTGPYGRLSSQCSRRLRELQKEGK